MVAMRLQCYQVAAAGIPWLHKELTAATDDCIELRICASFGPGPSMKIMKFTSNDTNRNISIGLIHNSYC